MPSSFRRVRTLSGRSAPLSRFGEGLIALLVGAVLTNCPLAGPVLTGSPLREVETSPEGSEEVDEGAERISFSTPHRPTIPRRAAPSPLRSTPSFKGSVGPVGTAPSDRATTLEERTLCLRR